jgi:hypothetical protein
VHRAVRALRESALPDRGRFADVGRVGSGEEGLPPRDSDSLKRYIVAWGRSKACDGGDTIANTRGRVRSPEFRGVAVTPALPKE